MKCSRRKPQRHFTHNPEPGGYHEDHIFRQFDTLIDVCSAEIYQDYTTEYRHKRLFALRNRVVSGVDFVVGSAAGLPFAGDFCRSFAELQASAGQVSTGNLCLAALSAIGITIGIDRHKRAELAEASAEVIEWERDEVLEFCEETLITQETTASIFAANDPANKIFL
jgi:hypothetical protein